MERRLAAILAADVVGYSRLMGEDAAANLDALKARCDDLVEPNIAEHEERVVEVVERAHPVERLRVARGVLEQDGM